jgi:hypothetical protein
MVMTEPEGGFVRCHLSLSASSSKKKKKRHPSLKTKEKEKKKGKKSGSGQDRVDVLPPTHLACFLCVIGWAESLFQVISWIGGRHYQSPCSSRVGQSRHPVEFYMFSQFF